MRLIILFLLLSFGCEAQIIRAQPFYRPLACQGLLLDCYPNAAAAYSLRKLKSSYSGSAIKVRRSSDNTTQDIGFTANGDLDTASMKTFVGANNGFVTTFYNQGDSSSVDFTQGTSGNQPRIINAGTVERVNGKPTIRFISTSSNFMDVSSSTSKFSFLHKSGQSAIFFTGQSGLVSDPNALYTFLDNNQGASQTLVGITFLYDDRASLPVNNALASVVTRGVNGTDVDRCTPTNYLLPNVLFLATNLLDNNNSTAANRNILYLNGGNEQKLNTVTNAPSTANANYNLRLGRFANTTLFPLNGYVSEIVIYSSDKSSNRTGIESNINSYYSIW